ncbi:SRPBCC family protein [Sphingomonas profundi]|uniref:SRPBCC family protein n=1 Tax=Alterirhizorhabdus profundi TaxID=2681549 RepID=UPI0012E962C8|nr:SRPBCC domain-containing protein [Sphingomonas profundi]
MSDTSLTIVRRMRASPDTVFAALIRPELIARWWGPDDGPVLLSEADARVGGAFRVRFRMLDDSEHESVGTYLEVAAPTRLAMTWRWIGRPDPESLLEFDLRPIAGGTELTLTHSRLPDAGERDGHRLGWSGALDKLERLIAARSTAGEGTDHAA